ncbi:MAG: BON domain-containing protein [Planctomycetaceae bacterium]|nr:BON domain-containing protein [Planctomycetaceae bacterium]
MSALARPRPVRSFVGDPDSAIRTRILIHLRERGIALPQRMAVDVNTGEVTLRGDASSPFERQMIVMVVKRFAPGIRVVDELRVVPVAARPTPRFGALGTFAEDLWITLKESVASIPRPALAVIVLGIIVPVWMAIAAASGPSRVPVHPVSGRITFDGVPAEGARITLNSIGISPLRDINPTATVNADGTFDVMVYAKGDGAPIGEYVATVRWYKTVPDGAGSETKSNVLPANYGEINRSPLRIVVKKGRNEVPDINIKGK